MSRLALHAAIVMAILVAVAIVWQLRYAVLLFVLSLAIAAALRPLIDALIARRWPKSLAVMAAYLQVIVGLAILVVLTVQPLFDEMKRFGDAVLSANDQIASTWPDRGGWRATLVRHLPPRDELYRELLGSRGISLLQTALGATFGLFANLVDAIVVIVMSLYWSIDRDRFERLWITVLPVRYRSAARDIWSSIEYESGTYLRAELVQSAGAAVLLWGGLSLIGYPFPTIASVFGAIVWLVPWVGMLLAAVGIVAFALPAVVLQHGAASSNWLLFSVAYTLSVLLALEVFIEPRVFGRRRYNSLLVAIVMIGLTNSLGIIGLILGPPLAAVVQIVGVRLLKRRMVGEATEEETNLAEQVARLRESLAEDPQQAPQLTNIVERLTDLVDEAQPVLPSEPPEGKTAGVSGSAEVRSSGDS
ncbi:MAG TPA: AI-2E family transporter [Pirellulales bacterium]|nr:AI-2E family transporter [Pirellulales bacterium]